MNSRAWQRHHRAAGIFRNLNVALLAAIMLASFAWTGASAQGQSVQAYVWANDPLAESYTPNELYSYNSTGGENTITRTDVGTYTVTLAGVNSGAGNVQVTATSGSNPDAPFDIGHICKLANEGSGSNFFVSCFATGGEPVDTGFSLLYTAGDVFLGWNSAYLWANFLYADLPTVDERYQMNITGATNAVERVDAGHYVVTLPGLGTEEGNVQVSPVNDSSAVACTPGSWSIDDQQNKIVNVYCFDAAGQLAESNFFLLHVAGVKSHSAEGAWEVWPRGAYVWVNHASSPNLFVPGKNFQFNTLGGDAEAQRTELGTYSITIPNVGIHGGNIQVTPLGSETSGLSCTVSWWDVTEDATLLVTITCHDAAGNPADVRFMLSYVQPEP